MSLCKCPGVPQDHSPGMAADKCIKPKAGNCAHGIDGEYQSVKLLISAGNRKNASAIF